MQKYRGFQIDNLEDVKFINAILRLTLNNCSTTIYNNILTCDIRDFH